MVKVLKIVIIILTLMISSSCCSMFNNGNPCVDVENLKGFGEYQDISKFRIDGYYYSEHKENNFYCIIFFTNGILYKGGFINDNFESNIFEQFENNFNNIKYDKFRWGSYQIAGLELSRYFYNSVLMWRRNIFLVNGKILNDTTFVENDYYEDIKTSEVQYLIREKLDTFHFRKLEHKPDSTNFLMRDEYLQEKMKKGYEEYIKRKK